VELTLTHQTRTRVNVHCDGRFSHAFQLPTLQSYDATASLNHPIVYGIKLYNALFPPASLAQRTIATVTDRLALVTSEDDIDAIPWEYTYGPDGFLVLRYPFVRTLPIDQRISPAVSAESLRIVAIPSHPLSHDLAPLNIEEEWLRLQEIIEELPYAITLERTRPPTLERTRHLLANHTGQVIHFMGHGGQEIQGAVLCFERDNGDMQKITARELTLRIRDTVFLVVLNACVSAAPGPTPLSNLASALVQQKIPYALGMRLSISDREARIFSRVFYSELARGVPVEEALLQTRIALADTPNPHIVGVPVLYTALTAPTSGFSHCEGKAEIRAYQSHTDLSALSGVEGLFQGRIDELKALGELLTRSERAHLITIHGPGGQGKSALAREAAERFAYAWPGGVWATNLENLPDYTLFVTDLARFLGLNTRDTADPQEIEHHIQVSLAQRRTLLLIDSAEMLVDAVEKNDSNALQLAAFLRQLPVSTVSLLVTSRVLLGWNNEQRLDLGGLSPEAGAALFRQCASQRADEITSSLVQQLSRKVEGHPLSLRLLCSAFITRKVSFLQFVDECEERLIQAEDIYRHVEHRQRKLYASIEIGVKELDEETQVLLRGLSIFHASFLAETVVTIFTSVSSEANDETEQDDRERQAFYRRLQLLWQRGLLSCQQVVTREKTLEFYHLLPVVRLYIEHFLKELPERQELLKRFGLAYANLSYSLASKLESSPATAGVIAQQAREDLERGLNYTEGEKYISYLMCWGQMMLYLGSTHHARRLMERALEIAQVDNQHLVPQISLRIASVYSLMGRFQEALVLYQQTVPILQKMGDRREEISTFIGMAAIYSAIGKRQEALSLYEQTLLIVRELGDRTQETTLYNLMMRVYSERGKPQEALKLYENFLHILRKPELVSLEDVSIVTNVARVYSELGKRQEALSLYEQVLPIVREFGNPALEGSVLYQTALVCNEMGQRERALSLFEEALSIHRKVENRTGEAMTLSGIAVIYDAIGKSKEALDIYSQILPLTRKMGNRVGEAATLKYMALAYKRLGKLEEALTFYEQALPICREVNDRSTEASTLSGIAGIYSYRGQMQKALALDEEALSIRREIGDRAGEANTLHNMAHVYEEMGQPQPALALCQSALRIRREVGDRAGEAVTLCNMARAYEQMELPQEALPLYQQALPIMREVGDRSGEATAHAGMVLAYSMLGQLQEVLTVCEEALPIVREAGDRQAEAAVLIATAVIYSQKGREQEAIALYKEALPLLRELGKRAEEAVALTGIAEIHSKQGSPLEALPFYQQALPLIRELGNRVEEAKVLSGMASIYSETWRPQEALDSYQQALPIMREMGNRRAVAKMLMDMALAYSNMGKPDQTISHLEEALPFYRTEKERVGEALCLFGIAFAHNQMGKPQQALEFYEKVLLIERKVGDPTGEVATLSRMAEIYSQTGQPQQALILYKEALAVQQEAGNREGEVTTLNSLARLHSQMRQQQEAFALYEQALSIARQEKNYLGEFNTLNGLTAFYRSQRRLNDSLTTMQQAFALIEKMIQPAGEIANHFGMVKLLFQQMNQPGAEQARGLFMKQDGLQQDVTRLFGERMPQILQTIRQNVPIIPVTNQLMEHIRPAVTDLSQDMADLFAKRLEQSLDQKNLRGAPPSSTASPAEHFQDVIDTTILIMTEQVEQLPDWRERVSMLLEYAIQEGADWQAEVDFFTAVLIILDGEIPTLPEQHPYAQALVDILKGIDKSEAFPDEEG
jgi:pentatricopeptide repeat protein